ncbi:hypothetical protein ACCS60_00480 [Rhizobium acaciae]|uniref:hypothetical protein n=1 Tax=Rhizobium acaciae TaxID=2989736 RepID=UPI000380314B
MPEQKPGESRVFAVCACGQQFSIRLLLQDFKCFIVEIEVNLVSLFRVFIYMVTGSLDRGNLERKFHTSRYGIGGMPNRQNSAQAFLDGLAVPICSDAQIFQVITWVAQITATATEQFSLRTKRGYQ